MSEPLEPFVEMLRNGGVVACATETFFGLLADATNEAAVDKVVHIKKRETTEPIALLLPDASAMATVAREVPETARQLAGRFWPGALTLLVPAREGLPAILVREGKVGVRVPGPSPALDLVRAFGGPVTATSANRAGEEPASTDEQVRASLGDEVDLVVPGRSPGGLPSTLVDATVSPVQVLRPGAVDPTVPL